MEGKYKDMSMKCTKDWEEVSLATRRKGTNINNFCTYCKKRICMRVLCLNGYKGGRKIAPTCGGVKWFVIWVIVM